MRSYKEFAEYVKNKSHGENGRYTVYFVDLYTGQPKRRHFLNEKGLNLDLENLKSFLSVLERQISSIAGNYVVVKGGKTLFRLGHTHDRYTGKKIPHEKLAYFMKGVVKK